jgi:hypothetical protein
MTARARTGAQYLCVIYVIRDPAIRCMASITIISTGNMLSRFSGRDRTVVTINTIANNLAVIHIIRGPGICDVTVFANVGGINVRT